MGSISPIQFDIIGLDIAQEFCHELVEGVQFSRYRLNSLDWLCVR